MRRWQCILLIAWIALVAPLFLVHPTASADLPLPDKLLYVISAQAPVRQFNSPISTTVASDGSVYVIDLNNHRIQQFSATGEFLRTWGHMGEGEGEFRGPQGIAVASDGTVYVADTGNHRIQRFTATGQFLDQWGRYCAIDYTCPLGHFNKPGGVAIGPDGSVYVADTLNHQIQRFTATGEFIQRWNGRGAPGGLIISPEDITISQDGVVYILSDNPGKVHRYSADGQFQTTWSVENIGGVGYSSVTGLAVGLDGVVYVTDSQNQRVLRFDTNGQFLGQWDVVGYEGGQFISPSDVAVAPDGAVYIADTSSHLRFVNPDLIEASDTRYQRIQRFTSAGQFLGQWGQEGQGDGLFKYISGLDISRAGEVYVVDGRQRVERFSGLGQYLGGWGGSGMGDGQFDGAADVAVADDDSVYVVDGGNRRLQHFSADGQFLNKFPVQGRNENDRPWQVSIAPDDSLYVLNSSRAASHIQHYRADGKLLADWGNENPTLMDFVSFEAIAASGDGDVYAIDSIAMDRKIVKQYSPVGELLDGWGRSGYGQGLFYDPRRMTIAPDGTLYILERSANRVQRFTHKGEFLGGWTPNAFSDITISPNGLAYIADFARINVFGPAYPATWRTEYFGNHWLAERPLVVTQTHEINFEWRTAAPAPGVPADGFAVRFQRMIPLPDAGHVFTVQAQGGVRLWVGARLLLDQWDTPLGTRAGYVSLPAGEYLVRLEYNDLGGAAGVQLSWQSSPLAHRLYLPWTNRKHRSR